MGYKSNDSFDHFQISSSIILYPINIFNRNKLISSKVTTFILCFLKQYSNWRTIKFLSTIYEQVGRKNIKSFGNQVRD